ncbi:MAG: tRNA (cytidine(34)-2'-O)-methyltransferase [Saccharofermentans sp.]|jgi:tRNA (cytidine/uridine-2'-O-)-methyltransferase|nr:tRNA (cytidine(34)-2'-O)-methyltransferase [Mageeibacillus sp.]MCI1263535.1 tRNA (cytidine(34)-2'-O)-methyltransferase [Saccharofermentans sp.]MCI1274526.1 tRNA (cytidine(34)-2'-O)-methyltransferase [Saccharofermentans sp.]MCI2044127.1 tRNA (cytidine(34)-2'-O)-methyltransferase [Mageeibacillus sp.]
MNERVNVVLFEPEIPQNTGNIMRTCVAAGCGLHIIKPLGFDIEDRRFKRATTNHITWADYALYENYEDFIEDNSDGAYFFMTRYGKTAPSDIRFGSIAPDRRIYLVFGKESTGIPCEILRANMDRCFRIPMTPDCRCLNLSNACAIVIYEVMRQLGYPGLSGTEIQKGPDYLENYSYDATLKAPLE